MSVKIEYKEEARKKLKQGVDAIGDAVGVTLGAKGRNVIIEQGEYMYPHVTKDGVTVARSIILEDPVENMGAMLIKEAAAKTAENAGDGTTTSTVIAQELISKGVKLVAAGINPMLLKKGMEKATRDIVKEIQKIAEDVDNDMNVVERIAVISANNDEEIGKMIASAMKTVKKDGIVTVEESKGFDTYVDVVDGMQFNRGYLSNYFVNNTDRMEVIMEDARLLITDNSINSIQDILPILEHVAQNGQNLVIMASGFDQDVLNALIVNKMKGSLKVVAVKAPEYGEKQKDTLGDIAVMTGGEYFAHDVNPEMRYFTPAMLGSAEKVVITKDRTTIIRGKGEKEAIDARVEQIRGQLANAESEYDQDKYNERLAKITGGIAVLYVGAATEVEMKEKKDRVEDALAATRAALEEGIVPGGGVVYIKAINELESLGTDEISIGYKMVMEAVQKPAYLIAENAGENGGRIVERIKELDGCQGYNALENCWGDMKEMGIIDPAKVSRVALEYAVSAASMFLTTECAISTIKNQEAKAQQNQFGGF